MSKCRKPKTASARNSGARCQDWYKDAVIYQLHVRAFYDSNDDGVGDFCGLAQKLDYIKDLGVNAIWLLPFYESPLRDDGYDIADYQAINPAYGTLDDFREFVAAAHARDIRIIIELVVNHSSDQHPWFQRARNAPRRLHGLVDGTERIVDRLLQVDGERRQRLGRGIMPGVGLHRDKTVAQCIIALRDARRRVEGLARIAAIAAHIEPPIPGRRQRHLEFHFRMDDAQHTAELRDVTSRSDDFGEENRDMSIGEPREIPTRDARRDPAKTIVQRRLRSFDEAVAVLRERMRRNSVDQQQHDG